MKRSAVIFFLYISIISCSTIKQSEICNIPDWIIGVDYNARLRDSVLFDAQRVRYIKYNVQRAILLNLIFQLPFEDIYHSNNFVELFKKDRKTNFRKRYKGKYRNSTCNDLPFINDLLYLFPPPNCMLRMKVKKLIPIGQTIIKGRNYDEGPYSFYDISLITSENPMMSQSIHYSTIPSCLTYECDSSIIYTPKLSRNIFSEDTLKIKIKSTHYLVAINEMGNMDSYFSFPAYLQNSILFLSKEFLQYKSSLELLRDYMVRDFDTNQPNTFINYINLIAYSDYQGKNFKFNKKSKTKFYYTFYSDALEKQVEVSIIRKPPYDVDFISKN